MIRARRLVVLAAALGVSALALSGCAALTMGGAPATPRVEKTPDVAGVSAELLPFYSQTPEWESCEPKMFCTTIEAPRDWANPGAGKIELALIRHNADNGSPLGSLLINPGGPGGSGYDFVQQALTYAVGADVIKNYDVIGFDPRGVGKSTRVTCLDAPAMDDFLYGIVDAPRGSAEWTAKVEAGNKAFADACAAKSGEILPFITTINSARDMDLIRGVLGDKKLSYLGYSYGTFLGATYAELYPDKAGRMVLDGAIDPSTAGYDVSVTQALGFESALRSYMTSCLKSEGCPFSGTVDDALADLGALLASVDRTPLTSKTDARQVGADTLLTAIISALYSEQAWPMLTQALSTALQGVPAGVLGLADSYNSRNPDGTYLDNSTEAFRTYNCMDYPVENDPAAEAAAEAKIAEGAPTVAPYWSGPDTCRDWPVPPTGQRAPIHAEGSPPILVVGTTNDPATPYQWSEALAEQLSQGVLVTRVGEGHTGYNKGNSCVDKAVNGFLLDGTVPDDGLRCES